MAIRLFRREDIPAVVQLRRRCFRHSAHGTDAELEAQFDRLFFSSPWPHDAIRSLVYETAEGIVGFRGVVPRPMILDGARIWAAISTQFMVAPERRGSCAIELLRAFFSGPQDVSFADLATPVAKKLWTRLGGRTAYLQSLYWTRPLEPNGYILARAAEVGVNRWILRAARPICALANSLMKPTPGKSDERASSSWFTESLDVETWARLIERLPASYKLRPELSVDSLRWLLECLRGSLGHDRELVAKLIRDSDGRIGGWYAYLPKAGGLAQCLQIAALDASPNAVLELLTSDARDQNCVTLAGRVQPELIDELLGPPGAADRSGPYTLVHSRDLEIAAMMTDGAVWFTRLEGEYWMNF